MFYTLKWTSALLYSFNSNYYISDKEYIHATMTCPLKGNTTCFLRQTLILSVKAKLSMSKLKVFHQNSTVYERKKYLPNDL